MESNKILNLLMKPLNILENPIANGVIKIFLVVYASTIVQQLPNFMKKAFKNPAMKILFLSLVSYVGIKDPVMSLLIAIAFTLTMLSLNKLETLHDVHDILDAVIDVPQEVLNDLIDGSQDILKGSAKFVDSITNKAGITVAGPLVEMTNMVVDGVQGMSNDIIDGTQDLVGSVLENVIPKEEKTQEEKPEEKPEEKTEENVELFGNLNEEEDVEFEIGTLGDITGSDNLSSHSEL